MPFIFGFGLWLFPLFGMLLMAFFAWRMLSRGHRHGESFGLNSYHSRGCGASRSDEQWESKVPVKNAEDPLVLVRERYAQGLISKTEFDSVVEGLVKTEREHG
jgi:hypothetical protein